MNVPTKRELYATISRLEGQLASLMAGQQPAIPPTVITAEPPKAGNGKVPESLRVVFDILSGKDKDTREAILAAISEPDRSILAKALANATPKAESVYLTVTLVGRPHTGKGKDNKPGNVGWNSYGDKITVGGNVYRTNIFLMFDKSGGQPEPESPRVFDKLPIAIRHKVFKTGGEGFTVHGQTVVDGKAVSISGWLNRRKAVA